MPGTDQFELTALGSEMHERIARLYPICRSITGNGTRETLRLIGAELDLAIREVPTGTPVFDWRIPKEWNIRDAYIKNRLGERIVDFHASNLHVVNYSVPVQERMTLAELRPHLFSIPDRPDLIPYKTSYYKETWGFCLSHRQLQAMGDDVYDVCIDSSLEDGSLTYGEWCLPGQLADEVLLSCHVCHPSLCNDNLSGLSLAVTLARWLGAAPRHFTYRILFVPGTIGAITWLALNEQQASRIKHGLVLACVGDRGALSYKRSRQGVAVIDRAASHVLRLAGAGDRIEDFSPYGYDERQYCSPGFNLPVGVLSRTPHGQFAEYHTSGDNLAFVAPAALADSFNACVAILDIIEGSRVLVSRNPKCEPQLGRRGLYSLVGGHTEDARTREAALLWVLNLSDGTHSLLDIAERSGMPFPAIREAATALLERELLAEHRP